MSFCVAKSLRFPMSAKSPPHISPPLAELAAFSCEQAVSSVRRTGTSQRQKFSNISFQQDVALSAAHSA